MGGIVQISNALVGKFNGVHANGEIPAAYAGGYVYIDSTATAVTLPKASTVPAGSVYFCKTPRLARP